MLFKDAIAHKSEKRAKRHTFGRENCLELNQCLCWLMCGKMG